MKKIFCSVIIPVYNVEKYIEKCVESILGQSFEDLELILVNDGSTDESGKICDKYARKDKRIKVLHQVNAGHTAARNAGLRVAKGQYIGFVDSDDWVDKEWLEDCYTSCEENGYPDVILFGFRRVEKKRIIEKPQPYKKAQYYDRKKIEIEILPSLLSEGRFSLSERLMKKELVEKFQYDIDKKILLGEDLACCVCVLSVAKNVYILPRSYYNYVQHEKSVVHSYSNYTFENWELLRQYLNVHLKGTIPNYDRQLGTCSIRFLQRAVLGEVYRNGLKAIPQVKKKLKSEEIKEDINNAVISSKKRALQFKHYCLKHQFVFMLYISDFIAQKIRRR